MLNNTKEDSVKKNFDKITTGMDIFQIAIDRIDDAPDEWNFYKKLSESKMVELIESILENGLLSPPIVWQREDGRFIMLAGHNRRDAYNKIYEKTQNDKYKKMPCYMKKKDDITEEEARIIVIDTNFVQRQLSTYEKTRSIVYKYKTMGRKRRNSEGKTTAEIVAEEYNLAKTQVYNYLKLQTLIPQLLQFIDDGTISIKSGIKLSSLSKEIQNNLYVNNLNLLNNNSIKNITSDNYEIIVTQLQKIELDMENYTIKIPKEYLDELKEHLSRWEHYSILKL